jgi:multisubunit Na+/H+ antiporter MnhE subunit
MMRQLSELLFWWAAAMGVWLLTLSSMTLPEVSIAAAAGLPCAVVAIAARRAVGGSWPPRPAWLRWAAPLPVAVVADGVRVLGRAAGVLVGRRIGDGEIRPVQLPVERPAPRRHSREAMAVALVSATPGTVVFDLDDDSGRMHLHALGSGRPQVDEAVTE